VAPPDTKGKPRAFHSASPGGGLRGGVGSGSAHPLGTLRAEGRPVRRGRARIGAGGGSVWSARLYCQATPVVPRSAGGAAWPLPSEEEPAPEPQDARGRAAALRAQFRRRCPGGSRPLSPQAFPAPLAPRLSDPEPRRTLLLSPSPPRGQ
jgi:hypothetical protein